MGMLPNFSAIRSIVDGGELDIIPVVYFAQQDR